jgi:predicted acyltransferase
MGVLPRIGICFGLVGWFYLHSSRRLRWWTYAGLLVGYGALLLAWGDLSRDHSLPSRVDALLLGHFAYHYNGATGLGYDPEGIISTLGALASTLLGVQCGEWLRGRQLRAIALTGTGLLLAGLLLHWCWVTPGSGHAAAPAPLHAALGWLPMNKALWTPPFAMFAGGFSALMLVAVHLLIERLHMPPIGRRFGVNAITAYAGSILMVCLLDGSPLHGWIYQGLLALTGTGTDPRVPSHLYALLNVLFFWLVVWWMDKRRIKFSI